MEIRTAVDEKIRVFISSICGNDKYDTIRKKLKKQIEATGIARVYLFEDRPATTLTAEQDYLYALDDSDICVFLIDNADGVPDGVLKEYQRAKANSKKSIYIFCNENEKQSTHIQNEVTGARGAKYYIVNNFQEFEMLGYDSFINDIVGIYTSYCRGRLIDPEFIRPEGDIGEVDAGVAEDITKQLFKNMDKTKRYLENIIFSSPYVDAEDTCDLDSYCEDFLKVIFGAKTIREINMNLLLSTLEERQSIELHRVVVERWKAIQYYWLDNLDKAIECENQALKLARELNVSKWIVQDILIDLRNLYGYKGNKEGRWITDNLAQEELDKEVTALFYPLLDRYEKSLYEEVLKQEQKISTQSPYTVTWGNNLSEYAGYIANSYVVSFFNGSLTHILRIFDRVQYVAYSLCSQYNNWEFRVLLLKMAINKGKQKDVKNLINLFNEIYGKMNALDARNIYEFNMGTPINYRREISQLLSLQYLGYYFSDEDYLKITNEITAMINNWIEYEKRNILLGDYIFESLKANISRLDNQVILEIVLKVFEKDIFRFYDKALELVGIIDYSRVNTDSLSILITKLKAMIEKENTQKNYRKLGEAIISLRIQAKEETEELHNSVIEYMSDSYKENYYLEVLVNSQEESIDYIRKYISIIRERNMTQGKGGSYKGYMDDPYKTISNIISYNNVTVDKGLVEEIIDVCKETLYSKTQFLSTKVNSIKLITFLGTSLMEVAYNFKSLAYELIENGDIIFEGKDGMMLDKTSKTTLYFSYLMMKLAFNIVKFDEVIGVLGSYAGLSEYETLEALKTIIPMLENECSQEMDNDIMVIIFQFALQSSYDKNHDIRYYAVKTLINLINNQTKNSIMNRVSEIMDFDSVYIKNLILNNADKLSSVDIFVYEFIMEKAKVDNHYVIRNRAISEKN